MSQHTYFVDPEKRILGLAYKGDIATLHIVDNQIIAYKTKDPNPDNKKRRQIKCQIPMGLQHILCRVFTNKSNATDAILVGSFADHIIGLIEAHQ